MVTLCNFPTAGGWIWSAAGTKARGQVGLHFRFRKRRTVAPGISRRKHYARSWRRQRALRWLLATAALVRGDAVPDGGVAGATDRGSIPVGHGTDLFGARQ